MDKVWTKRYPKVIPKEIDVNAYRSAMEVFERSFSKFADNPMFSNMGKTLTYREMDRLSTAFAAYLQSVGLKKGDRIAIQLPNILQYPVALIGAFKAGLIVVNTNPLYTPREMTHQFKDSGAKAVVILANFANRLQEILPVGNVQQIIVTELGDLLPTPKRLIVNAVVKYIKRMVPNFNLPQAVSFRDALARGKNLSVTQVPLTHQDTAFIQYTGGTTGVAKGAVLTHKNIVANMLQVLAWMSPKLVEGKEIIITALPLYHVFSLTVNCLSFSAFGAHNILITNPRDMGGFLKEIAKWRFTIITGVNTLFNGMLNHPKFASIDFSGLKFGVAGAMALQSAVATRWKQVTGSTILEGYGLTETSPLVTCNPLEGDVRIGTIGLPVPSTEIKLVDDNGREVKQGESGEMCVRGPQVMQGYWNRPDETALTLIDGWLHTGDVAAVDADGYFKIVDRKKEMISVSGLKVFPNEVEEVVASHPGVLEVGAIGVPDEHSGEVVKVFVVKRDPALTEADVIAYCKERLTGYKVPRQVEFRKELPKSNVGKILRRLLREKEAA